MPVRRNEAFLFQSVRVAFNGKNSYVGRHALDDLVRDCFRTGK